MPLIPVLPLAHRLWQLGNYDSFLTQLCELTRPLPPIFRRCYIGTVLLLVGQLVLGKYHHSYSTVWYYEVALRRSLVLASAPSRALLPSSRLPGSPTSSTDGLHRARNRRKLAEQRTADITLASGTRRVERVERVLASTAGAANEAPGSQSMKRSKVSPGA